MTKVIVELSGGSGRSKFPWKGKMLSKKGVEELFGKSDLTVKFGKGTGKKSAVDVLVYADEAGKPSPSAVKRNPKAKVVKFSTFARAVCKTHTKTEKMTFYRKYGTDRALVFATFVLLAAPKGKNMYSRASVERAKTVKSAGRIFKKELEHEMFKYIGEVELVKYEYKDGEARTVFRMRTTDGGSVREGLDFTFSSDGWDIQYTDRMLTKKYQYSAYIKGLAVVEGDYKRGTVKLERDPYRALDEFVEDEE